MDSNQANQITLNIESLDSIVIKVEKLIDNKEKCYTVSYELNGVNYLTPTGNFYSPEINFKNDLIIKSELDLYGEIEDNIKMFSPIIKTDIILTSNIEVTKLFREHTIYSVKKYFKNSSNVFYRFDFDYKSFSDIEFGGIDKRDSPDYSDAYVQSGCYEDDDMSDFLIDEINETYNSGLRYDLLCKFKLGIL